MSWTPTDSESLYLMSSWGEGYFGINAQGHVEVSTEAHPKEANGRSDGNGTAEPGGRVDLYELMQQVQARGIAAPILFRFDGILRSRVRELNLAFNKACQEHGYTAPYCSIFPIKVNQERQVVEALLQQGREHDMGLEVGSKPELFAGIALQAGHQSLMICNGYKDAEYVEMALLATKVGVRTVIVIEKFSELELILQASRTLGIRPTVGVRTKIDARGTGRWQSSTGDHSKFGLTAMELVTVVDRLREHDMLDCLALLHFHIGSQVSHIRSVKDAMREATRTLAELSALGVSIRYFDAGGGLGIDYDGSRTNFDSSRNYSLSEYANDIVYLLGQACEENEIPHPTILTESGRALVAHHAVLVTEVIGVSKRCTSEAPILTGEEDSSIALDLAEMLPQITIKNYQEYYHDAKHMRGEAMLLYRTGSLSLRQKASVEWQYWRVLEQILHLTRKLEYVPDDLETLERSLADTYFLNFSLFQSVPDSWAIQQLFPILPLHRHDTRPDRRGVLADLTCDSDGKVERFIDLRNVKTSLELHSWKADEPYYIGFFLVGAYQEILGDLHNLFGDTNIVHVDTQGRVRGAEVTEPSNRPRLAHILRGERVKDVLAYVEYGEVDLLPRLREELESALELGSITYEESALLWRRYEEGLRGYTYLTRPGATTLGQPDPKETTSENSIRPPGRARVRNPR